MTEDGFYPNMETKVLMKWGVGANKRCTLPYTFVGPAGQCPRNPPPLNSCGTITDGNPQLIKIPRRCLQGAPDGLRFKTVTDHQSACDCDEAPHTRDATAWSSKIGRD